MDKHVLIMETVSLILEIQQMDTGATAMTSMQEMNVKFVSSTYCFQNSINDLLPYDLADFSYNQIIFLCIDTLWPKHSSKMGCIDNDWAGPGHSRSKCQEK